MEKWFIVVAVVVVGGGLAVLGMVLLQPEPEPEPVVMDRDTGLTIDAQKELMQEIGYLQQE